MSLMVKASQIKPDLGFSSCVFATVFLHY